MQGPGAGAPPAAARCDQGPEALGDGLRRRHRRGRGRRRPGPGRLRSEVGLGPGVGLRLRRDEPRQRRLHLGRGDPPPRVLDQHRLEYGAQGAGPLRWPRILHDHRGDLREVRLAVERTAALHGVVERAAQREQVRGRGGRPARGALRRQIARRAHQHGRQRVPRLASVRLHGDAVVGEHDTAVRRPGAVRCEQDVRRFHVPVHDTPPMPGGQRVQHGEADTGALRGLQGATPGDQLAQVHRARHVLHDDPRQPVVLQYVVHGDHMRMAAQPRRVPGLRTGPRHPGLPLVTGLHRVPEDDLLERDLAGESLVVGEPDMAHAAAAQLVQQQIAAGDDPAHSRRRLS